MKIWIVVAAILAALVIAGIFVSMNLVTADSQETETIDCSGCGNSCTAERNCGLKTCGAISGESCGCGK